MEFEVKNHFLEEKEDYSFPLVLKKKELKRGYRNLQILIKISFFLESFCTYSLI